MKVFLVALTVLAVSCHSTVMADFLEQNDNKKMVEDGGSSKKNGGGGAGDVSNAIAGGATIAEEAIGGCNFNKCIVDISKQVKAYSNILREVLKSEVGKNTEAFATAAGNLKKIVDIGNSIFQGFQAASSP